MHPIFNVEGSYNTPLGFMSYWCSHCVSDRSHSPLPPPLSCCVAGVLGWAAVWLWGDVQCISCIAWDIRTVLYVHVPCLLFPEVVYVQLWLRVHTRETGLIRGPTTMGWFHFPSIFVYFVRLLLVHYYEMIIPFYHPLPHHYTHL